MRVLLILTKTGKLLIENYFVQIIVYNLKLFIFIAIYSIGTFMQPNYYSSALIQSQFLTFQKGLLTLQKGIGLLTQQLHHLNSGKFGLNQKTIITQSFDDSLDQSFLLKNNNNEDSFILQLNNLRKDSEEQTSDTSLKNKKDLSPVSTPKIKFAKKNPFQSQVTTIKTSAIYKRSFQREYKSCPKKPPNLNLKKLIPQSTNKQLNFIQKGRSSSQSKTGKQKYNKFQGIETSAIKNNLVTSPFNNIIDYQRKLSYQKGQHPKIALTLKLIDQKRSKPIRLGGKMRIQPLI